MLLDFEVLIRQMLSFYTMIGVGFGGYCLRMVGDEDVAALSRFLVRIFIPAMLMTNIVNTVRTETLPKLPGLLFALFLTLALMLAIGWGTGKLFGLGEDTQGVHTAMMGLPNDGLLGYQLWLAVFPEEAGLAIMAGCIVYSIAQWGIAYPLTIPKGSETTFHWKKMLTPPLLSSAVGCAMVLADIHPEGNMVWDTLSGIGSCTKYVAMIYIGGVLAQKGICRTFKRPVLFATAFIKMLVIPFAIALILGVLPFLDRTYWCMVVMMSAMPAPVVVCIQAAMNRSDEEYAVGSMVLSTVICLGTIPLVMYLTALI